MDATFDLRSDTVTQPTAEMRAVMARAEVGDDAYGDDPSVAALERTVAALLGKPAACFLPTGTMANQLAVAVHTRPGQTLACHPGAHVRIHEDASPARLSGVQIMPIGDRRGYDADALAALLREESCGWPPVGLVWLENTVGDVGGCVWPLDDDGSGGSMRAIATLALEHGRPIHLDGARLWNAHVATGVPLAALCEVADTVSVSLSKGLGAPMGSLLCGDTASITTARRMRHGFGGGLRQAGIVAAAGLHALEHQLPRLVEDHRRARRLAEILSPVSAWEVAEPVTNMVIADLGPPFHSAEAVCGPLRAAGILCHPNTFREIRWVVHLGLDDAAIEVAGKRILDVVSGELRSLTS